MSVLAIHGGQAVRTKLFPAYHYIGDQEKQAVMRVMESGVLSGYYGDDSEGFLGGVEVQALEKEWAAYFGAKHAIAVNSCTSGLYCAAAAVGVGPGLEVITTPLSMMATATAILVNNAVPVFADVEEEYFCLDPQSVIQNITPRTRAIFVTDICGQPYDADILKEIADKHQLYIVEDNAQAPMAKYKNRFAGTLGDIGVFSLNYHKHIHCGEGGVVCTDDDELADKIRLVRNHAEAVLTGRIRNQPQSDLKNMLGFNYRLTEIQAAIARTQLTKLKSLVDERVQNCEYLADAIKDILGLKIAPTRKDCTHVYYVQCFLFDEDVAGIDKHSFVQAVAAELPRTEMREVERAALIDSHYGFPIYLAPLYQQQVGYGSQSCPFQCPHYEGKTSYSRGLCPVSERLWQKELIVHEMMRPPMTKSDLDDVAKAFWKVWEHREELKK